LLGVTGEDEFEFLRNAVIAVGDPVDTRTQYYKNDGEITGFCSVLALSVSLWLYNTLIFEIQIIYTERDPTKINTEINLNEFNFLFFFSYLFLLLTVYNKFEIFSK
jgi:hypothetical protein